MRYGTPNNPPSVSRPGTNFQGPIIPPVPPSVPLQTLSGVVAAGNQRKERIFGYQESNSPFTPLRVRFEGNVIWNSQVSLTNVFVVFSDSDQIWIFAPGDYIIGRWYTEFLLSPDLSGIASATITLINTELAGKK